MASSSSSSTSAPAFSSRYSYHVFLSFRGEDTRNNFVGHLYSALEHKGIQTYKDDKTLRQGETIGPALMKGINESQIALVVFSDNYADSSWCLDELVYIINCNKTRGQIVMPVFYKVDPSDVRKQKRKFGEAFEKHESKEAKLYSWREALKAVGNISGFHYEDPATRDESEFIKDIVEKVSQNMCPLTSRVNANLVGIETRMQDLESNLQIGSGGVCMIGVWGVGGGGKTTLASSFYNKVARAFDGCCLVEDIQAKSSKNGLESLQVKILCDVLKQDQVRVQGVNEGKHLIRDGLCRKKVLIVLDDVNKLNQLEALAGKHDWFGEGSLIIITTRDVHLLDAHQVDVIHEISLFKDDEAIQLFCRNAFRHHKPKEGYEQLSKEVVTYAGGLPLALTVIGCFLCDKDMKEWRSALARLKAIPEDEILEKLKISFDGLLPIEKELFLDIACFFRRKTKDEAVRTLDACGFYPDIGIKVLIEKALITVSEYGRFDMHDLVQEMGHHIVRGDHPNNPAKHSRVWKMEDVLNLSTMDAMTELDMIKAIRFEHSWDVRLQNLPQVVAKMKNVRWIDWECDLASPLPTNFSPRELCCLKFDGISQKQLWEDNKYLPSLKMMELYGLDNLIMTPNFEGLPNLKRFMVTDCHWLKEIHPSIGRLKHLVFLSIKFCSALKMFPPITGLKKLETLVFSRCPKLFKLSEIQQNHIGLQFSHRGLRKLDLSFCDLGDENMGSAVWALPNLEELDIAGNIFSVLNFSHLRLPLLKWLNVSGCEKLVKMSELPSSIAVLVADWCRSLETFGDTSKCELLWKVSLRGDNKLSSLAGDVLLNSMLQGNAPEHHFISVALQNQMIPKRFVGRMIRGKTRTLHLPHDWYTEFCGFLICIVTNKSHEGINILIRQEQEVDKDSRPESNEAQDPQYDGTGINFGYVSFSSLRETTLLSTSYNMISFCIKDMGGSSSGVESYVGAELVPKGYKVQTPDGLAFCDKEREEINTFMVKHDSKSCIRILWKPYHYTKKVVLKVDANYKQKRKALKNVSSLSGIESLAMDMKNNILTVIGDVDPVAIVTKLRKCCRTDLLSVGPAEEYISGRR